MRDARTINAGEIALLFIGSKFNETGFVKLREPAFADSP
jgi:hypothetical protein